MQGHFHQVRVAVEDVKPTFRTNPQHYSPVLLHALTMRTWGDTCSGAQSLFKDFSEAEETFAFRTMIQLGFAT